VGDGRKLRMQVMVTRPAMVIGPETNLAVKAFAAIGGPSIRVERLAETLIRFTLEGSEKVLWENAELKAGL
jgi:hypothetical protein